MKQGAKYEPRLVTDAEKEKSTRLLHKLAEKKKGETQPRRDEPVRD